MNDWNKMAHQGVVHYSASFPVTKTPCGLSRVPSTPTWAYVSYPGCLELAPPSSPEVEARRAGLAMPEEKP